MPAQLSLFGPAMETFVRKAVECFYPGKAFPAVSTTGRECALNCKHCSRKYLEGMIPARTPEDLLVLAEALAERGAAGILLSGGSDAKGKVALAPYVPAIETIKSTTDLKINAHIGLTPPDELRQLVASGIDSFSTDIYGDDDTIRDVLGLDAHVGDYLGVVEQLARLGAPVVAPHICVGIHGGKLGGEIGAIKLLKRLEPQALIIISLIPTRGSMYETVPAPSGDLLRTIIGRAREDLPGTKLVLGCMRSKLDRSYEYDLVRAGLDGIVLPATGTVERLSGEGYVVRKRASCCALI